MQEKVLNLFHLLTYQLLKRLSFLTSMTIFVIFLQTKP